MAYGRTKKINSCYQCTERVLGCHATCERHAEDKKKAIAEKRAKKQFLHPDGSRYFKTPEKVSASARQSKKRYR